MMDSPSRLSPTLSQSIVVLLRHGGETSWPMRPNQWGCCWGWRSADFACFQKLHLHNIIQHPKAPQLQRLRRDVFLVLEVPLKITMHPVHICAHYITVLYKHFYMCIDSYGSTPTILYYYVGNFHLLFAVQDTRVLTILTVWWFDVHWTAIPLQNCANHDELVAPGSPRIYTNWHRNMDDLLSQMGMGQN